MWAWPVGEWHRSTVDAARARLVLFHAISRRSRAATKGARLKVRWFSILVAGIAAVGSTGCGAVLYTANVAPASSSVEQARLAEAETRAPYEFYLSQAYLNKAREEAAEANYQDAIRFAETSEQNATRAIELARRNMRETGR